MMHTGTRADKRLRGGHDGPFEEQQARRREKQRALHPVRPARARGGLHPPGSGGGAGRRSGVIEERPTLCSCSLLGRERGRDVLRSSLKTARIIRTLDSRDMLQPLRSYDRRVRVQDRYRSSMRKTPQKLRGRGQNICPPNLAVQTERRRKHRHSSTSTGERLSSLCCWPLAWPGCGPASGSCPTLATCSPNPLRPPIC